jgi:polyisoprenoid-binding protein YceI
MFRLIAAIVLVALSSSVHADTLDDVKGRYSVEPSSLIRFSIAQLGGQAIEGRFTSFSGRFELGGEDASKSTVQFSLSPGSVEAGDPRVRDFIKSEAVFDVTNYPGVTFRSTSVIRTGETTAVIKGRLSAKGVTRDTAFDVRYEGREGRLVRFHVTGKLSRALFNMDVGTPLYSNVVVLDMQLTGRQF